MIFQLKDISLVRHGVRIARKIVDPAGRRRRQAISGHAIISSIPGELILEIVDWLSHPRDILNLSLTVSY